MNKNFSQKNSILIKSLMALLIAINTFPAYLSPVATKSGRKAQSKTSKPKPSPTKPSGYALWKKNKLAEWHKNNTELHVQKKTLLSELNAKLPQLKRQPSNKKLQQELLWHYNLLRELAEQPQAKTHSEIDKSWIKSVEQDIVRLANEQKQAQEAQAYELFKNDLRTTWQKNNIETTSQQQRFLRVELNRSLEGLTHTPNDKVNKRKALWFYNFLRELAQLPIIDSYKKIDRQWLLIGEYEEFKEAKELAWQKNNKNLQQQLKDLGEEIKSAVNALLQNSANPTIKKNAWWSSTLFFEKLHLSNIGSLSDFERDNRDLYNYISQKFQDINELDKQRKQQAKIDRWQLYMKMVAVDFEGTRRKYGIIDPFGNSMPHRYFADEDPIISYEDPKMITIEFDVFKEVKVAQWVKEHKQLADQLADIITHLEDAVKTTIDRNTVFTIYKEAVFYCMLGLELLDQPHGPMPSEISSFDLYTHISAHLEAFRKIHTMLTHQTASKTASPQDYVILGVTKESSLDEIKQAYRQLAKRWHPDKNQQDIEAATERFMEIQVAYQRIVQEKNQ